jgi:hypothetical protein
MNIKIKIYFIQNIEKKTERYNGSEKLKFLFVIKKVKKKKALKMKFVITKI